jgi:hypothetical protein
MLLILPVIAFWLIFLILRDNGLEWRRAALTATVFCGTCVVLITEIVSLPHLLNRPAVAISWLIVCVASFFYFVATRRHAPRPSPPEVHSGGALDRASKALLAGGGVIVLLVIALAIISAPSTWDAMEYHLPRVTMWMSNHSVRFFPTPDYCQLIYGPLAEYAMMHTYLLWGSDRFVNLIDAFSLLGSAIAVSLIAKKLGAGLRGQALAAVVSVTIPEGILEASGPMNTYVASCWIAITVVFLMEWNDSPGWFNTLCVGLAAALALLTKGTVYIFLPFAVLACWCMVSRPKQVLFLKHGVAMIAVILAINLPQYARSYEFSGSPLGLPLPVVYPRAQLTMPHVTVRGTLANVFRNVSLHMATPSESVNAKTGQMIRLAIRGIGADPDDPDAIWPNPPFEMNHFSLDEVHTGNPVQLALALICLGIVLWKLRDAGQRKAFWYALGIIASFTLFCAVIDWQIWSSRYHLPLFVLVSALVGFVLERYFPRGVGIAVGILVIAYALPYALVNRTRSLVPWSRVENVYHPRSLLYFADQHQAIAQGYSAIAEAVDGMHCENVAIDSYIPDPEFKRSPKSLFVYPLFALLHADGTSRSVWYTGVHNLTTRYAAQLSHPAPCAVICLGCAKVAAKWDEYRGEGGRASVFDDVVLFGAKGAMPNTAGSE